MIHSSPCLLTFLLFKIFQKLWVLFIQRIHFLLQCFVILIFSFNFVTFLFCQSFLLIEFSFVKFSIHHFTISIDFCVGTLFSFLENLISENVQLFIKVFYGHISLILFSRPLRVALSLQFSFKISVFFSKRNNLVIFQGLNLSVLR